jgi:hypothetical protein
MSGKILDLPIMLTDKEVQELIDWIDNLTLAQVKTLKDNVESLKLFDRGDDGQTTDTNSK